MSLTIRISPRGPPPIQSQIHPVLLPPQPSTISKTPQPHANPPVPELRPNLYNPQLLVLYFLRISGAILTWLEKLPSNFALHTTAFLVFVFSTGVSEGIVRENNSSVFIPYTVLGTARRIDRCIEVIESFF
jgi:hypothetical protein